jgi:hypothetical protein
MWGEGGGRHPERGRKGKKREMGGGDARDSILDDQRDDKIDRKDKEGKR